MQHFSRLLSSLKNRLTLFYALAFAPMLLILHYNPWVLVIALYGFLFLLLKNQKLQSAEKARFPQQVLSLIVTFGSFFIYYALVLVVPAVAFYGGSNYALFLLGLFLLFFDLSALKEAFTPIFFIVAANSTAFVAEWLKPYFSPYLGGIAYFIVDILKTLGVNVSVFYYSDLPIISFSSFSGSLILVSIAYECLGVSSALVFSLILVVVLFEDPESWKVKLLTSIIGVLGTFALSILRVTIILLTDYFYGAEAGVIVHYIIGYILFSAWVGFFLFVYYKRKTIRTKIELLWLRLNVPKI